MGLIYGRNLTDVIITGIFLLINAKEAIVFLPLHIREGMCVCVRRLPSCICNNCESSGDNGTVDGQGDVWWEMHHNKSLDYTRGPLVELIDSTDIIISNLTFKNSPFWNIHPVYCRSAP